MCGIAGWLGTTPEDQGTADRILRALRHRGPDASRMESWSEATLIHTRLSIIDLSPLGQQPMANEDRTVWAVLNGEIYNHRELRLNLEGRGHIFRGHSDTEVLPHLYEEKGAGFVSMLRGMFALAIYDTRNRILLLARDRFGIKPLFYAAGINRLAFASEIRALMHVPEIDLNPDRQAVYDFAALFFIPAPETFYRGIRALEPGELLQARFEQDKIAWKTQQYHRWLMATDTAITFAEASDQADALLNVAVGREMESDVPLGSFLSGGIDSSLVSAAAQRGLAGELATFNVSFAHKEYDETWAAIAVANHIGSHHQTLQMEDYRGTWERVTTLLRHAGQPFADTSLFAANAICSLIRQHVKVALSGDGGDESFGGYDQYWRIAEIVRLQRLPLQFWHAGKVLLGCLTELGIINERLPVMMRNITGADNTSILQALHCWIREEEHNYLCIDKDLLPIRRFFEPHWDYQLPTNASRCERLSAHATEINTRLRLANDFLFKMDTASMKESLEVRVPMLDEDLFAFGISLPHRLKVKAHTCKIVLREIAKRMLPADVVKKRKQGFAIPVHTWVDSDFKVQLRDALLGHSSRLPEFFRPETYRPLVQAFCDGRPYPSISTQSLYQRVIMLLSLHLTICEGTRKTYQLSRNDDCKSEYFTAQ